MKGKPVTDLQIRQAKASEKRQRLACGGSLYVMVEPISKASNSKSFVGNIRFPSGRKGKQIEVRIGSYGKGINEYSLKEARDEWDRLKHLSKEQNKDPRAIQKEEKVGNPYTKSSTPTLNEVVQRWMKFKQSSSTKKKWAISTAKDYENKVFNQIIPVLGGDNPIDSFSWENGGRTKLLDLKQSIEDRGKLSHATKVFMICRSIFDFSIDRGWMDEPNPARGSQLTRNEHIPTPNPFLDWDELPKFFDVFNENKINGNEVVRGSIKLLFLTLLRVESCVGMRFEEVDDEKELITIPASRMKSKREHYIPLTFQMKKLIQRMKEINGHQEYVFYSPRGTKNEFISKASPNTHIKRLGFGGKLTAHGIRATISTAATETLGFSKEIIQRQLAHAIGDETERSYFHEKFFQERREFLDAWGSALIELGLII